MGARVTIDGNGGVQVNITNTSNLPVEAIELEYPLRVEEYALIGGSGGAGHQGGGPLRSAEATGVAPLCLRRPAASPSPQTPLRSSKRLSRAATTPPDERTRHDIAEDAASGKFGPAYIAWNYGADPDAEETT